MPSTSEVRDAITHAPDRYRREAIKALSDYTGRDTILYSSAFTSQKLGNLPGTLLSIGTQDIAGLMSALHGLKGEELDLIIHSPGGTAEAAE